MNSYQKRKAEVKAADQKRWAAEGEFTTLKHFMLAISRGQAENAKNTLRHFENNKKIPDQEIEEMRSLIDWLCM